MKMLLWANKDEINIEMMEHMRAMFREKPYILSLRQLTKAWELSVIFNQIQKRFGDRKDLSILDFGTGLSPFPAYLNYIGYQNVTCLDKKPGWHPEMNQEIYNEMYDSHIKYIKMPDSLNYNGKHDVIYSNSVLEHLGDKGFGAISMLLKCLKPDGLFIHVVDYPRRINLKKLIDSCEIPISYEPEITPGCKEFKAPPPGTWWNMRQLTRIAFFNEQAGDK